MVDMFPINNLSICLHLRLPRTLKDMPLVACQTNKTYLQDTTLGQWTLLHNSSM